MRMVDRQLRRRGIHDLRILDAMERVPRHEFVSEQFRSSAYEDHPLPIGEEQTISQPFIVALMLQELSLRSDSTVLEIGTGSGYQTAILGEVAGRVFSIERHEALAVEARTILTRMGYRNIEIVVGDGSRGLPERSPYDAIVVAAAAKLVPQALIEQLAEGGRMVIPIGPADLQELQLVRKINGQAVISVLDGCRFVPLVTDGSGPA
jgi:protein-L-isoaspartate(D-aspartate) O-methyltransferase